MHTVAVLEQALLVAARAGYRIRQEWLDGRGTSACELRGRKLLFIDLAQSPDEQLGDVVEVLKREARMQEIEMPEALRRLLAG